jgi:hypothetical protein
MPLSLTQRSTGRHPGDRFLGHPGLDDEVSQGLLGGRFIMVVSSLSAGFIDLPLVLLENIHYQPHPARACKCLLAIK